LMARYVDACRTHMLQSDPVATSVFFGGGTPSLLPADLLLSILDAVIVAPGAEVTVECNPETVSSSSLLAYRRRGVTRVSFGVQSMVPHVLTLLGRQHSVSSVRDAVRFARSAGFETFNVDLIYGAAGETVDDAGDLPGAVFAVDHDHPGGRNLPAVVRVARQVADAVAATKKAKSLGATICKEVTEIPGIGWFSVITDPTGATLALWQMNPDYPKPDA